MKTLFILLLILSTSLLARENPFIPTNAYEEEKARIIEINEVEPIEEQQVVYVKPKLDVISKKELLPFITIEYNNDKIDIYSKYKVTKKITLPREKKIILDYNSKESFYTIRELLNSTNFPKITVGSHKKNNFFRVVVELIKMPENYKVNYDNDKVTIVKLYK